MNVPGLRQVTCLQEGCGLTFLSLILSTSPSGWYLVGTDELIWSTSLI